MEVAYIILAHKNPSQVARLINRLNVEGTIFSIHVDLSANIEKFKQEVYNFNSNKQNIQFIEKRYKSNWGGFNTIRVIVELINSVLSYNPINIITLSGQDYPIMNNSTIKEYLQMYNGKALLEHEIGSLDVTTPNRTNRYYFADYFNYNKNGSFNYKEVSMLPRILTKILPKKKFISGLKPYVGRVWFILPLDLAEFVVKEFKTNDVLRNFYKYSISSDEMYIQTLLLNSKFANRVINLRTTFANYNAPNPIVWKSGDIELLKAQKMPFARKFDINIDSKILDLIDIEILNKNQQANLE